MDLQTAIEDYLSEHTIKHAPRTLRWYEQKLDAWADHTGPIALDALRPSHVIEYLSTRTHLRSTTVHGDAQAIKTFLSWCVSADLLSSFRFDAIKPPKVDQTVIAVFTPAHIRQLLAACAQEESPALIARDRCLVLFLLDTGVRAEELCRLLLADLDIPHQCAKVLGKGSKERMVGFGQETATRLLRYVRRYRRSKPGVETVFTNRNGAPLTVSGLDQMLYRLNDWAALAGVRVSAHTFRHTFAVTYLMQGGDMYSLSRLLGHESVSTTQRYVRAATDSQILHQRPSIVDTLSGLR